MMLTFCTFKGCGMLTQAVLLDMQYEEKMMFILYKGTGLIHHEVNPLDE